MLRFVVIVFDGCVEMLELKTGQLGSIGDSTGKNGYKINIEVIPLLLSFCTAICAY